MYPWGLFLEEKDDFATSSKMSMSQPCEGDRGRAFQEERAVLVQPDIFKVNWFIEGQGRSCGVQVGKWSIQVEVGNIKIKLYLMLHVNLNSFIYLVGKKQGTNQRFQGRKRQGEGWLTFHFRPGTFLWESRCQT